MVGCEVRIVELPGLPAKGDVSDWLLTGGTVDELKVIIGTALPVTAESLAAAPSHNGLAFPSADGTKVPLPARKSQAGELVALASAAYRFGQGPDGEPFAVPHAGPGIARMLRGGRASLRAELAAVAERELLMRRAWLPPPIAAAQTARKE